MYYDFKKWDSFVIYHNNITEINMNKYPLSYGNIILHIQNTISQQPLIVLLKNFNRVNDYKGILVSFNGALTNKNHPPFFSFSNISDHLKAPLIAFSDPSLTLNETIKLSWYMGNINNLALQRNIAEIVNIISDNFKKKPILTGGSGGGFAALAISSLLNKPNISFVWNPQTIVKRYYKKFVNEYLETAFPNFISKNIDTQFKQIDQYRIITDLTKLHLKPNNELLYLQCSTDDFHLVNHCNPFILNQKFTKQTKVHQTYYQKDENKFILLENWGEGHIPPDRKTIINNIKRLLEGESSNDIARNALCISNTID